MSDRYQQIHEQTLGGNGAAGLDFEQLRAAFRGQVIAPGEEGYDTSRALFYGGYDPRPALVLRPADSSDVVQAVNLARESGLPLGVRGGGHSVAGLSVTDGGVLIDLRSLNGLEIDIDHRTAWAGGGLTAGEYTLAAAAHGLATPFGDTGTVGIGGLTLGGGVGYLVRKHGLTVDNLLAADLVAADGRLLRVDESHHPDLFWAIRGGGGNFGVVTRFLYRLHPVDEMVGGMLILPAEPEVLAGFMQLAEAAPEELSTIANVMLAPPMPFLPPEAHGKMILMAMMVYAGPVEEGQRALAPFRALAEPVADMLRAIQYPEMFPPEDEGYHPTAASRTLFLDRVDRAAAGRILERLQTYDAPFRVVQLRALGGAYARIPADATAYPHRAARIMANVAAFYTGPEDKAARDAWVEQFAAELNPGGNGMYVNFMGEEGRGRVRQAYPGPTWARLEQVKARYDPDNLFRSNHNIPPAAH